MSERELLVPHDSSVPLKPFSARPRHAESENERASAKISHRNTFLRSAMHRIGLTALPASARSVTSACLLQGPIRCAEGEETMGISGRELPNRHLCRAFA
ncbi:hypothetical protein [Amycolatopsis sp. NPDC004079]|uniref:hypothetical protein n=1 Tax=Amycolatopsis sp. NPDC004079 TaxID=3154549 RepID=UPI0033A78CAE